MYAYTLLAFFYVFIHLLERTEDIILVSHVANKFFHVC